MKDFVSWLTSNLSARTIIDVLAIISGVTGIVGFARDSFSTSQGLPWILIAIALCVAVYRLWIERSKFDFLQILGLKSKLSIEQAVAMLDGLHFPERVRSLNDMFDELPSNLSGSDVSALLGSLVFDDRVEGIRILAPKIRKKLSSVETKQILDPLVFDDRTKANRYLLGKED